MDASTLYLLTMRAQDLVKKSKREIVDEFTRTHGPSVYVKPSESKGKIIQLVLYFEFLQYIDEDEPF